MEVLEKLLSRVIAISERYELTSQKTGANFNVFDITAIEAKETSICRFISELIDPMGSHGQGDLYLKLFVEYVLHMKWSEQDYKTAHIKIEYLIKDDRRIDIVLQTDHHFIPIEVKVYAWDQNEQCADYYKCAKNSNLFYLTLYGNPPSEQSAKGLTPKNKDNVIGYDEVTQISFETEILTWLYQCLQTTETIKIASIREVLLQFIASVRKLTGQIEEGKELDIVKELSASSENMKAAFDIKKGLDICKDEMLKKVFTALDARINEPKLINQYDYAYGNYKKIRTYYDNKTGSTCPGISYLVKQDVKQNVDLWFRIEINHRLFAGFSTPENNVPGDRQLSDDEIKLHLPIAAQKTEGWWAHWQYLPQDNKNSAPNFKTPNDAYYNLFDANKFDQFVDECLVAIKKMWPGIKLK